MNPRDSGRKTPPQAIFELSRNSNGSLGNSNGSLTPPSFERETAEDIKKIKQAVKVLGTQQEFKLNIDTIRDMAYTHLRILNKIEKITRQYKHKEAQIVALLKYLDR